MGGVFNNIFLSYNMKAVHVFLVCFFDLILYVPVNNLSVMSGWVFLG